MWFGAHCYVLIVADQARINIKVIPGSSKNVLAGWLDGILKVRVTAKPEKGKANLAVVSLLASCLDMPKSKISIKSGHTSSRKSVLIDGISTKFARSALNGHCE